MKAITATFTFPDATTATAVASFRTLPGESPVTWIGNTRPIIDALPDFGVPQIGYASGFEDAMRHLAQLSGASVQITSEGEWEVFEE